MASERVAVSVPLLGRIVTAFDGRRVAVLVRPKELDVLFAVFFAVADGMVKDLSKSQTRKGLFVKQASGFSQNVAMNKSMCVIVTRDTFPIFPRPGDEHHRKGDDNTTNGVTPDVDLRILQFDRTRLLLEYNNIKRWRDAELSVIFMVFHP